MSYARGPKSDVYVFGSEDALECYLCNPQCARLGEGMRGFFAPYTDVPGEAEQQMIDHLLKLRRLGVRIPNRCIKRLSSEARGIKRPWLRKARHTKRR